MPFYRKHIDSIDITTSVEAPGYTLREEEPQSHSIRIDGWVYAKSLDDALLLFAGEAEEVPARIAKIVLLQSGWLGPDVKTALEMDAAISAVIEKLLAYGMPREAAKITWFESTSFERRNPMLVTMQKYLGRTDIELDQLFEKVRIMRAAELAA